MKFVHRLGFYLGGFVIGLIILFFFLGGKKTSCDYGMDARVLKNIRSKDLVYSESSLKTLSIRKLDTTSVNHILKTGDVNFSESNTKLETCKIYVVEGSSLNARMKLQIENCDKIATVQKVTFLE
tara:strand:+ start:191557 stop:191931 length:375 start_codon:yes stop_codon:yes gene_type:complete